MLLSYILLLRIVFPSLYFLFPRPPLTFSLPLLTYPLPLLYFLVPLPLPSFLLLGVRLGGRISACVGYLDEAVREGSQANEQNGPYKRYCKLFLIPFPLP